MPVAHRSIPLKPSNHLLEVHTSFSAPSIQQQLQITMHFTYGLTAVACLVGTALGQAKVKFSKSPVQSSII